MKPGEITYEHAASALIYDPATGVFIWKVRDDMRVQWNARYAGKVAGSLMPKGYRYIGINDVSHYAHRLAWLLTFKKLPKSEIDHIDGDKDNNRIANLREASHSQNLANRGKTRKNSSGFKGVNFNKILKKWRAETCVKGRSIHIGYFQTPEEAHAAYRDFVEKAHGEFARVA